MNWNDFFNISQRIGGRYVIIAGIGFVLYYIILRKSRGFKKSSIRFPKNRDYIREILYSLATIVIFTAATIFL
jgi:hypothetical protein